jgi:hypothetical protein
VRLEEQVKELKGANKRINVIAGNPGRSSLKALQGGGAEVIKPFHLMSADQRIEEQNSIIDVL